jgi:hypothetical protein
MSLECLSVCGSHLLYSEGNEEFVGMYVVKLFRVEVVCCNVYK